MSPVPRVLVVVQGGSSFGSGLPHAVGVAAGDDDAGVVEEPVEDAGGGGVLGQEPAPGLEGPVAGDAGGAAFAGGGDEAEQELGAGVAERGEADVVDLSGVRTSSDAFPRVVTLRTRPEGGQAVLMPCCWSRRRSRRSSPCPAASCSSSW